MALLQWKDSYSVGIAAVDHEHREMIDLINRLHDALTAGAGALTVAGFLGEIYKAISAHFALEERFMREHDYDQLKEHKQDHERLLDEIRDIMESYEADPAGSSRRLSAQLEAWFTIHSKTHDSRLHHRLGDHPH